MHRHGYKGRKFGRERDQRRALMRGLMCSLVEHRSIKTTLPKAKELRPRMEKVISKAKKGDLANRRAVIAALDSVNLGNRLVDEIAPHVKRTSGYLRIVKLDDTRVGDDAPMARIEFVDLGLIEKASESDKEPIEPETKKEEAK
ncbi:MAG: 50S ribosomal protein L17 [Candidatus Nomurabacteria bacterium]|jgi:large subunit ribosomal protein L17|nr:50S ribosomal protein L17 [Candidatus Nomurabacteria bacterium]